VRSGAVDGVVCRAHRVNADVGVLSGRRVMASSRGAQGPTVVSGSGAGPRGSWWRRVTRWNAVCTRERGRVHGW
jgi:hypothetical protein